MKGFRQDRPEDCGPACLATLADHFHIATSIQKMARVAGTTEKGTSLEGLEKAAQSLGLESRVLKGRMPEDKRDLSVPFIAHLRTSHFVVVRRVSGTRVSVFDPAVGHQSWTRQRFLEDWSGFLLILHPKVELRKPGTGLSAKRFVPLLRPHLVSLVTVGVVSLLLVVFGVASSLYLRYLIDEVIPAQAEWTLHILSVGVLVLTVLTALLDAIRRHLVLDFSQKIDLSLVFTFLNHVLRLPMSLFDRLQSGDILARLDDIQKVRAALSEVSVSFVMDTLMVVAVGLVLYLQAPTLFWLAVAVGILSGLVVWIFAADFLDKQRRLMADRSSIQSYLIEVLTGFATVKALNATNFIREEFEARQMESTWTHYHYGTAQTIQGILSGLVDGFGTNILYWIGCSLILAGEFTLGQLISFNILLTYFLGPFKRLLRLHPNLQGARLAARRVGEILDMEPESPNRSHGFRPESIRGEFRIQNLEFGYVPDRPSLNNLNLCIQSGQRVAFVGASGSGKTTALKLLLGLYAPSKGEILLDGQNLTDFDHEHLRNRIGYVPQEIFLFSGSVAANIRLHRTEATFDQVVEACHRAGAQEFILRLAERYQTVLNERGSMLSGGERQRLVLARALLGDPDLIVLDEATSHLDSGGESRLMETLEAFHRRGKTSILVTHRLRALECCDVIFVFQAGTIVDSGTHGELLQRCPTYLRLWSGAV